VGSLGEELLRPLVARARHQRPLEARLAQDGDGLLRRYRRPRVVTVVDVRVDDRELRRPPDGRRDEHPQEREELGHTRHLTGARFYPNGIVFEPGDLTPGSFALY